MTEPCLLIASLSGRGDKDEAQVADKVILWSSVIMWQKPARVLLEIHDAIRNFVVFIFFCIFSGALAFLLRECIKNKADGTDKLSFGLLAVSMSVFYGFHVYGVIAARPQTKGFRIQRFMLCLKLLFHLASFLVGFFVVGRTLVS